MEDRRVLALIAPVNYSTDAGPLTIVTEDFNNDGVADVATANYYDSTVSVLLGNADGTFQPALTSPTGPNPQSLAVGDFNEDGILDLATSHGYGYSYGYGYSGEVNVLLGNGDGTGAGTGTFQAPTSVGVGSPTSVAVGDFNGDGHLDLGVTSVYYYGYWYGSYSYANVLLGNGGGGFSWHSSTWLDWGYYTSATAADFNGDAIDDFAAVNFYYGNASVLLGNSSGWLGEATHWFAGNSPWSMVAEDVNGDSATDLVVANRYGNNVSVRLGTGGGGFGSAQDYAVGSEPVEVVVGDFNRDSRLDIATANFAGNDMSVLYGRDDDTFAPPLSFASPGAYALAAGDFNGDGWLDAATANLYSDSVSVLINDQAWPAAPASLSIDDVTVTEGDSGTVEAVFTVTRSGENLAGSVTVNYATANGGALAGSDYVAQSGTLTFADNETTKTITILVNGDLTDEYDQGFFVNLSGASGAVLSDGQGVGTILDNDAAPTVTITPLVSAREGNNNSTKSFNFVVTLSAPSEKDVWVTFATADGTATTANGDYIARSGSLYFAPGSTSQTISVQVKGDKKHEANETFFVNLTGATNATVAAGEGLGEILDDDTPPGKKKG